MLRGLRQDAQTFVVEALAVVIDLVLEPEAPDERERLLEPRRALLAGHPECLLLGGVRDAETERREQATLAEQVEARELLGEEDGVAAGEHLHARAELELLGAARPRPRVR